VRESESGARLTSGAERAAREGRARRGLARTGSWAEIGGHRRERGGSTGRNRPSREGEEVFPFFLIFLIFFSLIHFLLYTNIHLHFLGAKMKCCV
jgi:hypothetical protein